MRRLFLCGGCMPIPNVPRPDVLTIEETLRLRRFDGEFAFAWSWYQDPETVWLVDGIREPYTMEKLERMYRYLDAHGELYFVEVLEDAHWKPIGDVTFGQEDMPIVIGDSRFRGWHIGRKVIGALIKRGRELWYSRLSVGDIYEYNTGSRSCFESVGFRAGEKTELGHRYYLDL